MSEIWKDIPDFPDYQVSNMGRVRRITPRRGAPNPPTLMKTNLRPTGYSYIILRQRKKQKRMLVSRLILMAFVGRPFQGAFAAHINGNPRDNRLENLYWATVMENQADKERHGNVVRGVRVGRVKLNDEKVKEIRQQAAFSKLNYQDVGERYGVDRKTIRLIVQGRTWRHVEC